jgi:ribosomal protein S18 acetylase RimI-like enzyme
MTLDIESLERATLAAVPPQAMDTVDGWLVGLDDGTVGRAHSAVPLRHHGLPAGAVDAVVARFAAAGRPPVFRVPELPAFDPVRERLAAHGLVRTQPTLTMTGSVGDLCAQPSAAARVTLSPQPSEAWSALFLGTGFDPVDGASRLAILARSAGSVFASVQHDGAVVAVGFGCFAHGWCGVHGMRTAPAFRGRGLASAILSAIGGAGRARGLARCFLQVEQANAAAQKLYRRVGMSTAWCYAYWRR